jgi:hypothetical protein
MGHTTDEILAVFDRNGLTPHQFVRVRHGTRLGLHGMDVFDRGRGRDRDRGKRGGAGYHHANAHVPPPRSTRDGSGHPASAAARSTADGGTNA